MSRLLMFVCVGLAACTAGNPGFREDGRPAGSDSAAADASPLPPDGPLPPAEQGAPRDLSQTDSFACVPNSVLGCQNTNKLLRCSPAGDGTVLVDCSPYACNATYKRCNDCWPDADPQCDGLSVVTCTDQGLKKVTPCPFGCADGECESCVKQTYFQDKDKDGFGDSAVKIEACTPPAGYAPSPDDCNDNDPDAHPGQQGFFASPTKGTMSFDYNCDGKGEPELTGKVSCQKSSGGCTGDGWIGADPGCGQWAAWAACTKSPMSPDCVPALSLKQQRCR